MKIYRCVRIFDSEGCVNSSTFHVQFICRYYDYSFLYLFIRIVNNTNNNVKRCEI